MLAASFIWPVATNSKPCIKKLNSGINHRPASLVRLGLSLRVFPLNVCVFIKTKLIFCDACFVMIYCVHWIRSWENAHSKKTSDTQASAHTHFLFQWLTDNLFENRLNKWHTFASPESNAKRIKKHKPTPLCKCVMKMCIWFAKMNALLLNVNDDDVSWFWCVNKNLRHNNSLNDRATPAQWCQIFIRFISSGSLRKKGFQWERILPFFICGRIKQSKLFLPALRCFDLILSHFAIVFVRKNEYFNSKQQGCS